MKKLLFALFAAALAVCFSGCSSGNSEVEESVPETYTVTYLDGVNILEIAVPSDSNQYNAGDTVTVKFSDVGDRDYYTFAGWTDGTTSYTSSGTTTFTINSNVTLIAQWTFTSWPYDYEGTKASTAAKEVGDIVFNDGSSIPYKTFLSLDEAERNTKKAKAIALIFYKGTGLNSDTFEIDNGDPNTYLDDRINVTNSDTTTVRTLGVGLKHKRGLAWCSTDAQASDKVINTIVCVGNRPPASSFTFTGKKNGSDNLAKISEILAADENSEDDTNTEANYPAFYFAKNYKNITGSNVNGTDYENNWYLPSIAELYQISACRKDKINGFDIDNVSQYLSGDIFKDYPYLSSSLFLNGTSSVYDWQFNMETWCDIDRSYYSRFYCVCCIREFN